jgi:hypothetical protein
MRTGTLPPVSNSETWTDTITLYDDETGETLDTGDVTAFSIKLRDTNGSIALEGDLTSGHVAAAGVSTDGTFEFTFSADEMGALNAKTYEAGILITASGITRQIILGSLPVLEGL